MKYFSMFTGIGGFELGIQKAYDNLLKKTQEERDKDLQRLQSLPNGKSRTLWGSEPPSCIGFSEIDKYANRLLQIKWPEVKNYGDATKIDERQLPDFDLLVGGFPCQSFSIAGKRKGFDDTRGTLFFDIARILAHKKPRNILLENVKGLLSHDGGRTFQTIIGVLTDLGYFVEWQVLNSKNFGVPQNRERVFIVGHFGGQPRQKVFPVGKDDTISGEKREQRIQREVLGNRQEGNKPNNNSEVLEAGKDRSLHYIGGIEGKREKWLKDGKDNSRNFSQGQRVYGTKGISSTLAGNAGGLGGKTGLYMTDMRIRRLTPLECERLQGFPDNWTKDFSDTQRYKMMGNAVTVNVVQYVINKLFNI